MARLFDISKRRFPLVGSMLVLAGCMSLAPQRNRAYRFPQNAAPPTSAGAEVTTNRIPEPGSEIRIEDPVTLPQSGSDTPRSLPETAATSPDPAPLTNSPPQTPSDSDPGPLLPQSTPGETTPADSRPPRSAETPPLPVLPKVEPRPAPAPVKLELLVNVPKRKQVGTPAAYRLLVRNTSPETAEEVDVHCQFDPQLTFGNSTKREVRHRMGRLFPGESKELTLLLLAKTAGTHCCRFSVKARNERRESSPAETSTQSEAPGFEAVWKLVCVEYVSQQVQIEMLGPTLRTVGSRAEFNFKIANRSKKLLPKLHVVLHHDAAVAPAVVTQGATRDKASLAWDISDFKVDEMAQFQVDFDCKMAAHRVCLQVDVSGAGIPDDQTETCLQILPVQGALDLQISDREDPIVVCKRSEGVAGKGGRYEITVTNRGLQSAPQVRLDVNVSPLLKVTSAQVQQGPKLVPLKYELVEGRLLFDAFPELAPDEKLVYLVEVEGVGEGVADVRATLRSGLNNTAVSASEPTWVVAE